MLHWLLTPSFSRFLCVFIVVWYIMNRRNVAKKIKLQSINDNASPSIILIGNENYSLSGLVYGSKRIPDIEIKSKALYLDGEFKRNLARNSRLYNRGNGIFVDGKYIG